MNDDIIIYISLYKIIKRSLLNRSSHFGIIRKYVVQDIVDEGKPPIYGLHTSRGIANSGNMVNSHESRWSQVQIANNTKSRPEIKM